MSSIALRASSLTSRRFSASCSAIARRFLPLSSNIRMSFAMCQLTRHLIACALPAIRPTSMGPWTYANISTT
eukprot:1774085-Alexandrium_andersonii.AAC.1